MERTTFEPEHDAYPASARRISRIHGGTSEIMKIVGRSLELG